MYSAPEERSRRQQYDRETSDLLNKIETKRNREGRELDGPWSELWEEIFEVLFQHFQPIARLYWDADMGEMSPYLCPETVNSSDFVRELCRHQRSFIELGVKEMFEIHAMKLARLIQSVGTRPVESDNLLKMIWYVQEMMKLVPDTMPGKEDMTSKEDGDVALEQLAIAKNEISQKFDVIKVQVRQELNSDPRYFQRRSSGSYDSQGYQSGWNMNTNQSSNLHNSNHGFKSSSSHKSFQNRLERSSSFAENDSILSRQNSTNLAQRSNSGSFSTSSMMHQRESPRPNATQLGISAVAAASLPVRPQQFKFQPPRPSAPYRSQSGSSSQSNRKGSYSPQKPRNELRKCVSDSFASGGGGGFGQPKPPQQQQQQQQQSWRQQEHDAGFGFSYNNQPPNEGGVGRNTSSSSNRGNGRGGGGGRGYSSRQNTGPRRELEANQGAGSYDQANEDTGDDGWGGFTTPSGGGGGGFNQSNAPKSKGKNQKPKMKVDRSKISNESGWGALEETATVTENAWGEPTEPTTNVTATAATTDKQDNPLLSSFGDPKVQTSGWGSGTNINAAAWGSDPASWTQPSSEAKNFYQDSGWGAQPPATIAPLSSSTTLDKNSPPKRGPPPGFAPKQTQQQESNQTTQTVNGMGDWQQQQDFGSHPSYPPGLDPSDAWKEDSYVDEMEATEENY